MKKYKAFISYRKEYGNDADLIKNTLVNKYLFSEDDIFLDKHNIGPTRFDNQIEFSLKNSSSLVLIVRPGCFNPKEDDWFINEIKIALSNNITIIPVFFGGLENLSNEKEYLKLSFTAEEIEILEKSQGAQYDFNFSEQVFSKLSVFINECYIKLKDNQQRRMLILKNIGIWALFVTVLLTVSFVLFIGVGFLWGYFSSSKTEENVLKDNTTIVDNTAYFKFCGLEATYNLTKDSICVNYEHQEELPYRPYDVFMQSISSFSGAFLLLNNNLTYLKYLKYFKGGGKHRQIIFLGAAAITCLGSCCGFSQGSQWGRLSKQQQTVLILQPKLREREVWSAVFEDNFSLKIVHTRILRDLNKEKFMNVINVHIWICPDTICSIAKEKGLKDFSILFRFNDWEVGKNTYAELMKIIESSRNQKKHLVFQEITEKGYVVKDVELPPGIVGIRFLPPDEYVDINETIEDYNKWKRYKEWESN